MSVFPTEIIHNNKSSNGPSKVSVSKSMMPPNEQEICRIKSKLTETLFRSDISSKKTFTKNTKSTTAAVKPCTINEIVKNNKGVVAIHVPPDNSLSKKLPKHMRQQKYARQSPTESQKIDCGIGTERNMFVTKEVIVQTQPEPSQSMETQTMEIEIVDREMHQVSSDVKVILYDCLDTPNIKLTKDKKYMPKENIVPVDLKQSLSSLESRPSMSIPSDEVTFEGLGSPRKNLELSLKRSSSKNIPSKKNKKKEESPKKNPEIILKHSLNGLESPPLNNISTKDEYNNEGDNPQRSPLLIQVEDSSQKNSSFIISRRTLTYTTKQEINFDVGDSKNKNTLDYSFSNLSPSLKDYPLNVMTVFRSDNINSQSKMTSASTNEKTQTTKDEAIKIDCMNDDNRNVSVNCSSPYDSCKLIKPSEIISTVRVNTGLLQNDYICKQFERELNFIDSFFESLQYLETCSLAEKCCSDSKVENWVNNSGFENPEYDSLFSNLENGAATDTETMASKSLCLVSVILFAVNITLENVTYLRTFYFF